MGAIITDLAANYSNDLPIYGRIASQDGLKLLVRASSAANLIDLSPIENSLAVVANDLRYTAEGIRATRYPLLRSGYVSTADDSFTELIAFKLELSTNSSYDHILGGTFVTTSNGGASIRFFSGSDPDNAGKFRLSFRQLISRKIISSGVVEASYIDLHVQNNLDALPATVQGYVVQRVNAVTGEQMIRSMTHGLQTLSIRNPATYNMYASGRNPNAYQHCVGGDPTGTGASGNRVQIIPHAMYYSRALSDAELAVQYGLDQAWLQAARGLTV